MRLETAGAVNQFNGVFNDSVKIEVPSFRGLEPSMNLQYSSSGDSSYLGVGWSLPAFGRIERMSKGRGTPNYDSTDIFILDGQELVPCTSTSVSPSCTTAKTAFGTYSGYYSTKIESYLRIKYDSAAETWTVWSPSGAVATYTGTEGHWAGSMGYMTWGLTQAKDTKGNAVNYNWSANQFGSAWMYPDSVTYVNAGSSTPIATIKLYWEQRPDPITRANGVGFETIWGRIKTIDVSVNGTRARAYKLSYANTSQTALSLLTSAKQYGTDAVLDASGTITGGSSLPAQTFTYAGATAGFSTDQGLDTQLSDANGWNTSESYYGTIQYADLNGDGKDDYCARGPDGMICALSNGSDYSAASNWATNFRDAASWGTSASYWKTIRLADITGDGRADICARGSTGIMCMISDGTKFTSSSIWTSDFSNSLGWSTSESNWGTIEFPDLNGDGKADVCGRGNNGMVCALSNGTSFGSSSYWTAKYNSTDGWSNPYYYGTIEFPDLNGDGKADICGRASQGLYCALSTGTAFTAPSYWNSEFTNAQGWSDAEAYWGTIRYPDVNGDGKADVCGRSATGMVCQLSTGNSFTSKFTSTSSFTDAQGYDNEIYWRSMQWGDVNGDGRDDLCVRGQSGIWCTYSAGNALVPGTLAAALFTDAGGWAADKDNWATIRMSDFDGDGKADICGRANAGIRCAPSKGTGSSFAQDRILTSTSTYGGTISVSYSPSSSFSNSYPHPPVQAAVTALTKNDGRGGSATDKFTYNGGLFDPRERRFLGFHYVKATQPCIQNETSCPYTETWFQQDYASFSQAQEVKVWLAGYGGQAGTLAQYSKNEFTLNNSTVPYTAAITGTWDYDYNPDGTYRKAYKKFSYGSYGNVALTYDYGDPDVSGDGESTTQSSIAPNLTSYIVDRPARTMVFDGIGTTGTLLADELHYYDGATAETTPPTAGFETNQKSWDSTLNAYTSHSQSFDTYGNVTKVCEAIPSDCSTFTTTTYDSLKLFELSTVNPEGFTTSKTWNAACGQEVTAKDVNGQTTTTTLDAFCRVTRIDQPGGGYSRVSYVSLGSPTTQKIVTYTPPLSSGGAEQWSANYLDGLGRTWQEEQSAPGGTSIVSALVFDARGSVTSQNEPYYKTDTVGASTLMERDSLGRITKTTFPDGSSETKSYDDLTTTTTNPLGELRREITNDDGDVIELGEYDGNSWQSLKLGYDSSGNISSVTDPSGNVISITYDSLGRKKSMTDPNRGTWSWEYDGDGRITAETNGNGERTEVQYDDIGREFARTYRKADGTVERMTTFGFDEVRTGPSGTYFNEGHLTSISDPNGSTTYDYDASGELVRTVRTVGGVSYTTENGFDGEGRLLWTKYPDGTTVGTTTSPRTYDDAGRLKTVPGWVNDATYDAAGRLTKLVLANGVTTERAYDVSGALKRIWTYKGTTTIQDQNYGRNALGMATTVTSNVSTESWTNGYDTQNRLISAVNTGSSSYSQSFTFDPGTYNILTNSLVGTYIYAASRPHQVLSAGGTFYNYNANGAMTNGGGRTLTWDSRGLLTRVVKGATTADFQYDGLGQRTMKTVQNGTIVTTTYVSENYVVVNGTPSIYVFFDDMLIGKQVTGAKYWLHEDQSESLARITDSTGALVRSRAYRPFGETLSSTGTVDDLHAFLGEELDETGLLHLNARYYDPSLGVFVSPDSLIPQTSLDAFNPYAYSAGDPINQGDRSGNSWSKWGTYSKAADKAGDESKGLEALEKNWNILTSAISPAQKHHKPIAIGMAGINNKWKKKNYTNGFTSVSGFAGSGGSCPLCLWLPNWNLKKGLFSQTNQAELAMAKAMVRRAVDHGLVVRLQAHSNGHAALRDLLTSYANNGGDWRRIASVHMIAPAVDKKSWRSILSTASAHGVSINAFMFEHDTPMSAANSTRVDGNTNNSHDFDDNMAPEHFKQLAHSYPRTHVRLLKGSGHKIQKILDTVQDRFGKKVAHGYYRPRVMFDGRKITASGRSE